MKIKSKKGIPLVELICVIAIMGFLLTLLGSLFVSLSAQYVRVMDKNHAKTATVLLLETMEPRVRLAKEATVADARSQSAGAISWYATPQGVVEYTNNVETPLLPDAEYKGLQCNVRFAPQGTRAVTITVEFTKKGEPVYTESRTVLLLNTLPTKAPGAGTVTGQASGAYFVFVK